jgi:hypothetical protein
MLVSMGVLELRANATYTMQLEHRDSCRFTLLNMASDSGAVVQIGDSLALRAPDGTQLYWGQVRQEEVIISGKSVTLAFKR